MRLEALALRPVFLHTRMMAGSVEDRLNRAMEQLSERISGLGSLRGQIDGDVAGDWDRLALSRAPGGRILEAVARRYGVKFSKEGGDSARLARLISRDSIPQELQRLLAEVTT